MGLELREVLDGADHLRGVGVLVVVPSDDLDLEEAFADLGDHGLGGIEERAKAHTDDVGGDERFLGVAEGSGGGGLHRGVDLLRGDVFALDDGDEDGRGAGRDGDALGGADELAVEFGDDEADRLGGAGGVRDDVRGTGTGTAEVAFTMRAVEDHLVAGVGVDGGHDTGLDREGIVEGLRHRGEAVGGAGSGGDDLVFLGEGLLVDGEDDGLEVLAGRGGDDDFLGAGFDVGHGFLFGAIEASALEHDVDAELTPGEVHGFGFGIDGDLLAIDDDGARDLDGLAVFLVFRFDGIDGVEILADDAAITLLGGVVLQEVGEHLGAREVVDGDDFVAFGTKHLTESETANASESVNRNFN